VSVLVSLLAEVVHLTLMIVATPFAAGATDWIDARLAGRSGPPILLPWRDLIRLWRKIGVVAESASPAMAVLPAVGLGATLCAAALVPSFTLGMAFAPLADLLVIVSLLSVARIARALAALDAGTALSGLAAQRNSALAVLAEPALLLFVFTLALMGGSFNLDLIIGQQREGLLLPAAASALALTSLLALVFVDSSDPAGGLDQHFSGIDLALLRLTSWLRRIVWIDLIGGLFLPVGMAGADAGVADWMTGIACWTLKVVMFVIAHSCIHSLIGRIARRDMPDLSGIAALLALLATIMVLASGGPA